MRYSIPVLVMLIAIPCCAANQVGDAIQQIMDSHRQRVNRAKEQFDRQANSSRKIAVSKLVPFATAADKKRDTATASKVWAEVLSLDDRHSEARNYFTAIGKLDEVLNAIESRTHDDRLESKLRNTKWKWPYKSTHYMFHLQANHKAILYTSSNAKGIEGVWEIACPQTVILRFSGTYTMVFNDSATQFKCYAPSDNGHNHGIGTIVSP